MRISNRMKFVLFILLIALNLILRYPLIDGELGIDSYEIHILANSVSTFGEARWWVNPLGIIGMYPNSYASSTPFFLSGISQCTGLDVESVMFLYGLIFGLFTIIAAYIVAGKIYDDDLYKFLVAFGFSTCEGVLNYTTWTAPARSPFIIILPLFLYALFSSRKYPFRFVFITSMLSLLLLATHHLVFYLIPIFAGFFAVLLFYRFKEQIVPILTRILNFTGKLPLPATIKENIRSIEVFENLMPIFLILGFGLMLAYPFLTHSFMSTSSRWANLSLMLNEYPRYIGIPVFLAVGGFVHLIFKSDKRYEEWSLLTILMFLCVFIFDERYMKWFILIFAFLLAAIGFINIFRLSESGGKKSAVFLIIIFLLSSVCMSSFYQYWRTSGGLDFRTDYIRMDEHASAFWLNEYTNGASISNYQAMGSRIGAISTTPFFVGSYSNDQAYGFVDVRDWELEEVPITSEEFWLSSPYKRVSGLDADGHWVTLMKYEYNSPRGSEMVSKLNLTYLVENTELHGLAASRHGTPRSNFLYSIYEERISMYDNGKIRIWYI